jgi:hypothetical protein
LLVVFFLLVDALVSAFNVLMFQNTLNHSIFICGVSRKIPVTPPMKMELTEYSEASAHKKFRCRGVTQKKEYNVQNMVKV